MASVCHILLSVPSMCVTAARVRLVLLKSGDCLLVILVLILLSAFAISVL